jgi:NAD(P)-dependent dehydrogenase (short-subunit alcohol dehydrogenase family)
MSTRTQGGRAALVTGASTGIGAATALRLDAAGWTVFAGVRRDADAEALRGRATRRLQPVILDVTDAAAIASTREMVAAAVGAAGLHGLVNNAGIAVAAPLEYVPLDDLRRQLEVNVVGLVAVTQAFLPLLRRARGRVVNIGSTSGFLTPAFMGPYCASKYAVEAISDALRRELRPWGLEVALVQPGDIATPIWEKSSTAGRELEARLSDEARERYGAAIQSMKAYAAETGRKASPAEEVAAVVEDALTARRPRTRYLVGRGATIQSTLARWVPDRTLDGMLEKEMGLPRVR